MKVAYWPGCVSRGFTPELHGSMALIADRLGTEERLVRDRVPRLRAALALDEPATRKAYERATRRPLDAIYVS